MKLQESERTEFKSIVVTDIKKEIIAFANCDGGKIYIGIEDDGTVIGVEDSDSVALQVSNMVRDAIKPDLTMFLHYETKEIEQKQVVIIDIQRGTPILYSEERVKTRRRICKTRIFFCPSNGYSY